MESYDEQAKSLISSLRRIRGASLTPSRTIIAKISECLKRVVDSSTDVTISLSDGSYNLSANAKTRKDRLRQVLQQMLQDIDNPV